VLGAEFSAADVMLGFTLVAGRMLGVLGERFPELCACTERLEARPAPIRARRD
jgi:glutathione S-transferase